MPPSWVGLARQRMVTPQQIVLSPLRPFQDKCHCYPCYYSHRLWHRLLLQASHKREMLSCSSTSGTHARWHDVVSVLGVSQQLKQQIAGRHTDATSHSSNVQQSRLLFIVHLHSMLHGVWETQCRHIPAVGPSLCKLKGLPDVTQHFLAPLAVTHTQQTLIVVLIIPVSKQQVKLDHLYQLIVTVGVLWCKVQSSHLWAATHCVTT